jgi:LPPG:FO 2-phospho-L-lactate transferase
LKVVALAGGTGSAKLLRGLYELPIDLQVVANVGDNMWVYGVYVCPDVDIACYTLAGIADRVKGWGVAGDSFEALSQLSRLGAETWFRMGDRDLAVSLVRTQMLRAGASLTQATETLRKALGVKCPVIPATDDPVETRVITPEGDLHLQEFWVKKRGLPRVERVRYRGARRARVAPLAESAIRKADRVILCPANPVTSIGPMLALPGFAPMLKSGGRVVALSPMAGKAPFSGPAGKLMNATGSKPDSAGVARLYSKFLDSILISDADVALRGEVESMGVECVTTDIRMSNRADELRLAKELIEV